MRHIFVDNLAVHLAAVFALTLIWYNDRDHQIPPPLPSVFDRLLMLRLHSTHQIIIGWSGTALAMHLGLLRNTWVPTLSDVEVQQIRISIEKPEDRFRLKEYVVLGDLMVAFHAGTVFSDDELAKHLAQAIKSVPQPPPDSASMQQQVVSMLEQMGEAGSKYLKAVKEKKKGTSVTSGKTVKN